MELDKLSPRNLAALISFIAAKLLGFICFGLVFIWPAAFWPTLGLMIFFLSLSICLAIYEYLSSLPEKKKALYEKLRKEFEDDKASSL